MTANYSSSPREYSQPSRRQRKSPFLSGLLLILIGIPLASCTSAQPSDPVSVVQAAYERFNEEDVDGFMEFFSEDAVIIDVTGRYAGSQAIRDYLIKTVMPGHHRVELSDLRSKGNVVTFTAKIYERNRWVGTEYGELDVVVGGRIIFEGDEASLLQECESDPSQAFCPGKGHEIGQKKLLGWLA